MMNNCMIAIENTDKAEPTLLSITAKKHKFYTGLSS